MPILARIVNGAKKFNGSNSVAVFCNISLFVRMILGGGSTLKVKQSFSAFHSTPNVLTDGKSPSSDKLLARSFTGTSASTSGEFDIHFRILKPAPFSKVEISCRNLIPSWGEFTLSIKSSTYIEFRSDSAASGYSCLFSLT